MPDHKPPPPSESARRVSAHLSPAALAACGERGSLSAAINRSLDRYAYLMDALRPGVEDRFSPAELDLIRDALNGWWADPAATVAGGVAAEVEDALPDLAAKWDVTNSALMQKIRALTLPEEFALVDAVERYWRGVSQAQGGHDADA